jgi:GntR family transcriptional regulator / MocR family aminotransferase
MAPPWHRLKGQNLENGVGQGGGKPRLDVALERGAAEPLFQQIAGRIRAAIVTGHLAPGARLPAARTLAVQLAVARGTISAAYELLAGEGAIVTRRSAGTVISGSGAKLRPGSTPFLFEPKEPVEPPLPLAFRMGLPAMDEFPRKLWSNLTVHAARGAIPADTDPAGLAALRREVAAYLGVARGIQCSPADILITGGYQGALALVRSVLVGRGDSVWIEDPGYFMTRQALEASGARIVPIRVDQDGLRVASAIGAAPKAKLAVVTPTHQCPTGVALSLPRRLELLAWAAEAGAWVLEDDYDSEFRYTGRPLPSLKSLDREHRVLYAGSFSKVLLPALRLGYLVVPPELSDAFRRAAKLLTSGQPALEQAVVAQFMQKGHFGRHIRRMRNLYGARRQALAAALRQVFGTSCSLEMAAGGMHLIARFSGRESDTKVVKRAMTAGLAPSALSSLAMAHDCGQGLLLSFTNIPADQAEAMATRLRSVVDR